MVRALLDTLVQSYGEYPEHEELWLERWEP